MSLNYDQSYDSNYIDDAFEALKASIDALDKDSQINSDTEKLNFLKGVLQSPVVCSLVRVQEKLLKDTYQPYTDDLVSLVSEVKEICTTILPISKRPESRELVELLSNIHLEAIMESHDVIASKSYTENHENESFEMEEFNSDAGGFDDLPGTIRFVGIRKKDDEPLGMTVRVEDNKVVIARIIKGGLIDRQEILHVGDIILEVNGVEINSPQELMEQMAKAKGSVSLKIVPSLIEPVPAPTTPCYMRALYSYDPSEDTLLPCKELGLPFCQGDVLEILNQEDPHWWQARRTDIEDSPAGLIPSQELEERRKAFVRPEFDYATKTSICGTRVTKKKKREMYQIKQNNAFDKAELALYEEVCRIPPFERKSLVLIGAQGVGRRTLKNRLIAYSPDRFAAPLPHTSRPIKENEQDGKVYHFVKRDIMEADINNQGYLEWGEYDGHLYGTKLDSIREIIRSGKMCVIDCNPQCLKILKTPEYMPFVVFIASPPIDQLRYMHEWGRSHGIHASHRAMTIDRAFGRSSRRARTLQSLASFYEDEDLLATIEESARLHRTYEKYFDMILVNNNFDKTFEDLKNSLELLSKEDQWVPINWVYSE